MVFGPRRNQNVVVSTFYLHSIIEMNPFLFVDTQSVGTTIAVGQNMQIGHSLICKQNREFNVRPTDIDFPK